MNGEGGKRVGGKCSKQTNQQIRTEQNIGEYFICSQEDKSSLSLRGMEEITRDF